MIGYTCVGTNDLEKAVHFYGELLGLLNAKPFFKSERGVGWGGVGWGGVSPLTSPCSVS